MMLAKSLQSAAGNAAGEAVYIEDVMSTFLYTGNGSSQTITNGIDLAGEGGLVWIKNRAVSNNAIIDTVRTRSKVIFANTTAAEVTSGSTNDLTSFNGDGFSVGTTSNASVNSNGASYVSWTFRKQEKFFDCVTYTGNGTSQNIAHSLGSVPGCIIVKDISNTRAWSVYHTSLGNTQNLILSGTNAAATATDWNNTTPTATEFTVGTNVRTNASGATYVAYLFAHNAGGFGLSGEDNVISCGSFTTDGSGNATVSLGYEPQFVLFKSSSATGNWNMFDVMRGMAQTQSNWLNPNTIDAENVMSSKWMTPDATGFSSSGGNLAISTTYIYIAIRRGPMKVPESGTSVFNTSFAQSTAPWMVSGFPMDAGIKVYRPGGTDHQFASRLTGTGRLFTNNANAEASNSLWKWDYMNGYINSTGATNDQMSWNFRRAPGFFDEVCYTGNGSVQNVTHNLTVAPQLVIVKQRSAAGESWAVQATPALSAGSVGFLDLTAAFDANSQFNSTAPTSTVFTVGSSGNTNDSGQTYVAYLFATCPGVSKCGSFTGNGSSQTINCGFTAGARFVLIKAASTTGDWLVADSARGIVSGNDPYLELNTTNAEVTGEDWLDTDSSGFVVNEVSGSNANTNGVTYIYLAIA